MPYGNNNAEQILIILEFLFSSALLASTMGFFFQSHVAVKVSFQIR